MGGENIKNRIINKISPIAFNYKVIGKIFRYLGSLYFTP